VLLFRSRGGMGMRTGVAAVVAEAGAHDVAMSRKGPAV